MTQRSVFVPLRPAFRKFEVSGVIYLGFADEVYLALGVWAPGGMDATLVREWKGTPLREISAWLKQYLKSNFLNLSDLWATDGDATHVVSSKDWKTTLSDFLVKEGFPKIRSIEEISPATREYLWGAR